MNFDKFIFDTKKSLSKHAPAICTATGIVSMFVGAVLAVRATKPALKHIEEADIPEDASKKERAVGTFKAVWKDYTPAAICEIGGAALLIGSSRAYANRNANLANALYISETAYRNLQDKLDEKLTKKQVNEIRDSLAEDKVRENPPENNTIIITDNGKHLFFDAMTGQYFRSSFEAVHRAVNDVNAAINRELYVQANVLITEWGEIPCKTFEKMYWETGEQVYLRETTMTMHGQEVTCLEYDVGHMDY